MALMDAIAEGVRRCAFSMLLLCLAIGIFGWTCIKIEGRFLSVVAEMDRVVTQDQLACLKLQELSCPQKMWKLVGKRLEKIGGRLTVDSRRSEAKIEARISSDAQAFDSFWLTVRALPIRLEEGQIQIGPSGIEVLVLAKVAR